MHSITGMYVLFYVYTDIDREEVYSSRSIRICVYSIWVIYVQYIYTDTLHVPRFRVIMRTI